MGCQYRHLLWNLAHESAPQHLKGTALTLQAQDRFLDAVDNSNAPHCPVLSALVAAGIPHETGCVSSPQERIASASRTSRPDNYLGHLMVPS